MMVFLQFGGQINSTHVHTMHPNMEAVYVDTVR